MLLISIMKNNISVSASEQRSASEQTSASLLKQIADEVTACSMCPRLVEWREHVGRVKRNAYRDEHYWAKGVSGFGDSDARLMVVGLAPAAHGANRTGRMFTGDRSGDWLYDALHRAGYASQPYSESRDDGLSLSDVWITAPVKCAPPANKPKPIERDTCGAYLKREIDALSNLRVLLALGGFAYQAVWRVLSARKLHEGRRLNSRPNSRPKFSHGLEVPLAGGLKLLCSYHVSQQNTFTGRLTKPMFDVIISRARMLCDNLVHDLAYEQLQT